jgi:hypothetical protein
MLKESAHQPPHKRDKDTQQDHAGNGKIKPEVSAYDANVSGQVTKPAENIAEQPDESAHDYEQYAYDQYEFTDVVHHINIADFIFSIKNQLFCKISFSSKVQNST